MVWTLFRTRKGLMEVERVIGEKIRQIGQRLNELNVANNQFWEGIRREANTKGYDVDNYLRAGPSLLSGERKILDEKIRLEREKIALENQLIKVQQKIKKSIF